MKFFYTFLCLLCLSTSFAQLSIKDFQLGGAATQISDLCIRLVPDYQYTAGSAWYKNAIDLNSPFEMEICLMLGDKDLDGADGIVFVFYPEKEFTGYRGEGMGFGGLRPSLGLEFDTYLNYHLNDPEEDHLAIMTNGRINHYFNSLAPIPIGNIEDGERHRLRILWDPQAQNLEVILDNNSLVVYNQDLINNVFQGNSIVYWGMTAATGRLSNNHEICIKKLLFAEVPPKEKSKKTVAKKGGQ